MSKYESTKQLFSMKNVLLNQGVTCIYLSESTIESKYHMDLMASLFRFDDYNRDQYWFRYSGALLYFKSASNPVHTLCGYKARIVADHRALQAKNPNVREFLDLIYHSRRYEHL